MSTEMSDEAREARAKYMRDWKRRNPDKLKAAAARYWQKKADSVPIEERAYLLHMQGYSLREIADRLNVSHMTISRILKQN
jgi:DNA-directed RNA polymerase specialized sigma subunit